MAPESAPGWFFRVADLPSKEVLKEIHVRSVHLENLMMTFIEYPADATVPTHYHPFEQITYVLDGRLEVTVAGERRILGAGEGVCIRANAEHGSRPVDGPARVVDAWTPVPEHLKPDGS
jgi:quercetin dioxygenase-like cupin family protein